MTGMQLVAVNIGRPERIPGYRPLTGICKRALDGPVAIGELGLADDAILDRKRHGGPDQAVYLYGQPDYDWWAEQLGRPLPPGLFGENLTVSGLESANILIGDRFQIGDVLLEATSPRNPCATFAARMGGDPHWVKRFFAAGRMGVYGRVLRAGTVEAGMPVAYTRFAGEAVEGVRE